MRGPGGFSRSLCRKSDGGAWALSSRVAPLPDRLRSNLLVRRMPWVPALLALAVAVVFPLMIDTNARYFLYSRMALIAIIVVSVTILTGWAGQLSLAQFALAGLGAMTMAGADLHLNLQFLPAVAFAVAVCAAAAVVMGIPSLRVRGMYLAIVTLAFANAAYAWLFHQRIFNGGRDASRYEPDHLRIGSLDLSDRVVEPARGNDERKADDRQRDHARDDRSYVAQVSVAHQYMLARQ